MSDKRVITDEQSALVLDALNALADLAIAYERRLVNKGRYRSRATEAAVKYGGAKAILRSLPREEERAG